MKHWLNTHYKTLIVTAFLIPIITVAIVSISHVTKWYGISNPVSWAVYLSIGIEIAALSALAAISANMGKKVYFPFAIVTLVQFIGNIFFAYSYIDIASKSFQDWVGLVSPLLELTGVEANDFVGHKRFLAFFAGGMLPIISLSFLHMLIKFSEEDRTKETSSVIPEQTPQQLKDFVDEVTRVHLSEEDLKILESALMNPPKPNEELVKAAQQYEEKKVQEEFNTRKELLATIMQKDEELGLYDEKPYAGPNTIFPKEVEYTDEYNKPLYENPIAIIPNSREEYLMKQDPQELARMREEFFASEGKRILAQMTQDNQDMGLYDEPSKTPTSAQEMMLSTNEDIINSIPADDDISDWDVTLMDGLEEEEPFFIEEELGNIFHKEPTIDEEVQNFSTITPENENIFQEEVNQFVLDVNAINTRLDEINYDIDSEIDEEEVKKKVELEVLPPIEVIETPTPTETLDMDSLYWESGENAIPLVDDESPTQVTYEDEVDESIIEESEQYNPFGAVFPRGGSKIIPRNVRNTKRRGFR